MFAIGNQSKISVYIALWESSYSPVVRKTSIWLQILNIYINTNILRYYHHAHTRASFAQNPVVREIELGKMEKYSLYSEKIKTGLTFDYA